tara:strand:- start:815 stop:1096 length:282 start_codon:yes stop_codon:yes gene_type:complete
MKTTQNNENTGYQVAVGDIRHVIILIKLEAYNAPRGISHGLLLPYLDNWAEHRAGYLAALMAERDRKRHLNTRAQTDIFRAALALSISILNQG